MIADDAASGRLLWQFDPQADALALHAYIIDLEWKAYRNDH